MLGGTQDTMAEMVLCLRRAGVRHKERIAAQALGSGLPPTEQFLQSSLPFKKGLYDD